MQAKDSGKFHSRRQCKRADGLLPTNYVRYATTANENRAPTANDRSVRIIDIGGRECDRPLSALSDE